MSRKRHAELRVLLTWLAVILLLLCRTAWSDDATRETISLDGTWRFQPTSGPDTAPRGNEWARITVPSSFSWWLQLPGRAHTSWRHERNIRNCWYEREMEIPETWDGRRIVLSFDEIDLDAIVFVDGRKVGEVLRPEGEIELTQHVKPGRHSLRVYVTFDYVGISRTLEQDIWMCGQRKEHLRKWCNNDPEKFRPSRMGLTGSVKLRAEPLTAIQDILIRTSFRKKRIGAVVWIHSRDGLRGGQIGLRVLENSDGRQVLKATLPIGDIREGLSSVTVATPWKDAVPWHVGAPHLYRAQLSLLDGSGKLIDRYPEITFGFREVWTEGREIMLNGVPFRLRTPWNHSPSTTPNWPFWEGLGYNGVELQPNPTSWCGWGGRPIINQETLESADRLGKALLVPAPRVRPIVTRLANPEVAAAYERELWLWVKRYGNHPSILCWLIDMNMGDWTEFLPQNIGRPLTPEEMERKKSWLKAVEIAKTVDPTRLVGFHSGGRPGDFQTGNVYLNFVPLQEREEWLSAWAEEGQEPFGAVEFGTPGWFNFFKWRYQWLPLHTEYCAIYFGDEAYSDEDDEYVKYIASLPPGSEKPEFLPSQLYVPIHHTAYLRLQELFLRNTIRSWRAWGINLGMHFWLQREGLGRMRHPDSRNWLRCYEWYKGTPEELRRRPVWANVIYDTIRRNNQPLLVYIGGNPRRFTAKDHSFWSGEEVQKSVVAVWDGVHKRALDIKWQLDIVENETSAKQGEMKLRLQPGAIVKKPWVLTMPHVTEKTSATLSIEAREKGEFLCDDSMELQIYPRTQPKLTAHRRWFLYDPTDDSAPTLRAMGISTEPYQLGRKLDAQDVLVVGRHGLFGETRTVFSADDVARGARVLILEQSWQPLEAMGFRAEDLYSRYVFPRCAGHPVLRGIGPEELANWRGESTLIARGPDAERKRLWEHAPHWGSYGNVATVLPETPHVGAFLPLLEAEFDLQYAPLLQWRHGKGMVIFCQLDLTGRVGVSPPATRIARSLLHYLDRGETPVQDRHVLYAGHDEDWSVVRELGFAAERVDAGSLSSELKNDALVIVGRGGVPDIKKALPNVCNFVRRGGAVLVLSQTADELRGDYLPWPLGVVTRKMARTAIEAGSRPDVFAGIGPQRLTWRALIECEAIYESGLPDGAWNGANGLLVEIPDQRGRWVLCQLDWRKFEDRQNKNHFRTRWRVRQLYRQILTNLGARSSRKIADRLGKPVYLAELCVVGPWKCIGPFTGATDGPSALDVATPIDGRPIPEGPLDAAGGKKASWVDIAPRTLGRVCLHHRYLPAPGAIAYAVTQVYSSRDRDAVFRLKCDEFMIFTLNGQAIADMREATPTGRQKKVVRGHLKAGWNELCAKVTSNGKGLSFCCSVSNPGDLRVAAVLSPPREAPDDIPPKRSLLPDPPKALPPSLYVEEVEPEDDPYGFTPW